MPEIHPTAIVDSHAKLSQDVVIGAFTIISSGVEIGSNDRI